MTTLMPTAEQQLAWVVDASKRAPVPEDEIRLHVSAALLTAVGGPAEINTALANLGPVTVDRIVSSHAEDVQAEVRGAVDAYLLGLHIDAAGLMDDIQAAPNNPMPGSWAEIDSRLAGLAPRVSFAAAEIGADGHCRVVHGVNQDVPRPLGSAFKLYVLGALGKAVADGRASWTEQLAIRDDWKSLGSEEPAGTKLSLAEYADKMISASDNTATDHLIHRLGRDAVQRQFALFGNQQVNVPLLSTKAFFELKAGAEYPARADAYLALPREARLSAVEELERLPLTGLGKWPEPRQIDQIEWRGSATDVCRAFSLLQKENQPEIGHALSIHDGGLGLDRTEFPTVWYKGGSEPGVLTMSYLVRGADGRTLVTSVMLSNPDAPFDENHVAAWGVTIAQAAVSLLSGLGS